LPKNRVRLILMKLGVMLEVDKTFTTIWLSRSSEVRVKVRSWPQSPDGTIFLEANTCCKFLVLWWHNHKWFTSTGMQSFRFYRKL